jgi:hypothetical protein
LETQAPEENFMKSNVMLQLSASYSAFLTPFRSYSFSFINSNQQILTENLNIGAGNLMMSKMEIYSLIELIA